MMNINFSGISYTTRVERDCGGHKVELKPLDPDSNVVEAALRTKSVIRYSNDEALAAFEEYIELDPESKRAQEILGTLDIRYIRTHRLR